MLSTISSLLVLPTLVLISLPLLPLALLTSTIALLALSLRAALVYLELATALLKQLVAPDPPAALSVADYSLKSKPLYAKPLYSFSSSGSVAPRRPSTSHAASFHYPYSSYAAPAGASVSASGSVSNINMNSGALDRDFEGMGGWRDAGDDDRDRMEDALWTGLNSRLELPAAAMRMGSYTSLQMQHSGYPNAGPYGHGNGSGSGSGSWMMSSSLEKVQTSSTSSSGSGSGTGSGLTGARQRQHKRSWTSGAIRLDTSVSRRGGQGSVWPRPASREGSDGVGNASYSRPGSVGRLSGNISPEEGLMMAPKTKSFADIGARMNVGRQRGAYGYERRKSGSSGSVSSVEHVMMTGGS